MAWEWGVCSWREGCLIPGFLEWLQRCLTAVTVLVGADTALSWLVWPPSRGNQREPVKQAD